MGTILIIDDEPTIRALLKTQLEKTGHKIIEASDGVLGLAMAEDQAPDLVFLDVMIPKKDGWQVCRELKAAPKTSAMKVVMLTSCDQKIQELRGWESGADEYLTKPWKLAQVLDVTRRLLPVPNNP